MSDTHFIEERRVASDLVERMARGDPSAESELVVRYSRGLRFLLRRRTRDPDMAEDLLQETWAIALHRIRKSPLEDTGRLAGYLAGIARHLALNEMRKESRRKTTVNSEIVELIPDERSNPLRQASRAEVCRHVQSLLQELKKERDRRILELFYVQEMDKTRICEDLDLDSIHFNRVLYRARQRLREIILRQATRQQLRLVR